MTALAMAMIEGGGHTPSTAQFLDPSLEFVPRHCAVSHINVRYARSCRWLATKGMGPQIHNFCAGHNWPDPRRRFLASPTMPGIISAAERKQLHQSEPVPLTGQRRPPESVRRRDYASGSRT